MIYGIVLMILALYKAARLWRLHSGMRSSLGLMSILIRDQAIYFLACVVVSPV